MSKTAFVIMPYNRKYNRLYSLVIEPTLNEKGYKPIRESFRQDRTGEGGIIMNSVIEKIAQADIVISVLSGWNWNVAYETGISHTMNRRGTILLCDKGEEVDAPFDVKHLTITYYDSDWMEKESENVIIEELKKRIDHAEAANTVDSPVHQMYPKLPDKLYTLITADENSVARRLHELEEENRELKRRISDAGLSESREADEDDIEQTILQAIDDRIYYGDAAVAKLHELHDQGKIKEFGEFLAKVLKRGFLSETECRRVYRDCEDLKAPSLTRVFLERVTKQYPQNEELNIFLAEELCAYPHTRDKALVIANEMIGLSKKDGQYELSSKHVSRTALGAFFNVYLTLNMYGEILKIAPVLLKEYRNTGTQSLIYRNVMTAHLHFENAEEAEKICKKLIVLDAKNDLNYHAIFNYFLRTDQYIKAYEALENCMTCDNKDEDYYFFLASLILDEGIARTSANEPPHRISDSEAKKYAIPFILYVLNSEPSETTIQRAIKFLYKNKCQDVLDMLQNDMMLDDYSFDMVEYTRNCELNTLFDD